MAWRGLLRPVGFVRAGFAYAEDGRESSAPRDAEKTAPLACDPAERLARIALYAQAGYFHMSSTLDMMQMPVEIMPD
jgi:hypothetical protein